jgi:exodeoxyribonuclease-1
MSDEQTFYFYDLETSGVNPRTSRIMQFAGQRTDAQLNPIGEPHNLLIKLSDDVLPDPDAIMITGITPQQTVADGVSEVEFLETFYREIATPGTIFVGFNTVRFDDEFMRHLMWRNYYDPYEWQWKDGRSRWDLLDVVRMTRALRPEGIQWPFASDGRPTNRLELLTSLNKLEHSNAHDALSDVRATIAVAKLIREKQPKLFDFLLKMRDKKQVTALIEQPKPFVYTSGKYDGQYEKTTVAQKIGDNPKKQGALVYDLRHDPTEFLKLSPAELIDRWRWTRDEDAPPRLPVKTLQYNRCPAVAPLSVLDDASKERLGIDDKAIAHHRQLLEADPTFIDRVLEALQTMNEQQAALFADTRNVDARLYDAFVPDHDRSLYRDVHSDSASMPDFQDERLVELWPLYRARNFPRQLSDDERTAWEAFRQQKLLGGGQDSTAVKYFTRLSALAERTDLSQNDQYLLEELQLWGQSILPTEY